MANTVDPGETAHNEPSHLDLQCLQIQLLLCLVLYELRLQPMHKATNLLHVLYINITAITKTVSHLDATISGLVGDKGLGYKHDFLPFFRLRSHWTL